AAAHSGVEALVLQILIKISDELAIAVEQLRRHPLLCPEYALGGLAPARMRHLRIDIGPEAVLRRLERFPEAHRPLVGEGELYDRFDRLETILPRRHKPQRCAILRRCLVA